MTLSADEVKQLKQAPAHDGVIPAVLRRWSPRAYSDKPVSDADLKTIFEAVRWTASSSNEQPWRFIVGRKGSETYEKILSSLVEFNQLWAGKAPVLMIGLANTLNSKGATNGAAVYDLGQSAAMLVLQAADLGLEAHQMGGYDRDKARQLLGIPAEFHLGAALALGYQGDPSLLNEHQQQQETTPRKRKELSEFVFGEWGEALKLD
ncbi:nitroreductase family protein [Terracidiphilus sp.]|jgi:nitroreductase|uniref:nitroreductase family protein n=1 Tax=Terracidiphilus sp. TaxID=1964191 RepID=UPI003C2280C3